MPQSSLLRNVLSNWTVTASATAYSLFITPVVIRALNSEMYGVWSFLNALLAYSDLLYLGVGSALIKHIAQHANRADHESINRLGSVVFSIFAGLGLIVFLALAIASPVIPRIFSAPLSTEHYRTIAYTAALLGVQLLCFFPESAYISVLLGYNRFDLVNLARLSTIVVRFLLVSMVVSGQNPLLALAVFMTATVALEFTLVRFLAYRVDPHLRIRPVWPELKELRGLYAFGLPVFFIVLSSRLINYTDITVIGITLGATSVALYVLPLQLLEYTRLALGGFSGALLPQLAGLFAKGDLPALRAAYLQSTRIIALLAGFVMAHLLWLGVPFLTIWVGPEFGEPVRWVIIYLAGAATLHAFSVVVALPFYQAMNLMGVPARVLLIEALANLLLSLVFVRTIGLAGVALATFLPALLISFVVLPRYLCTHLSIPYTSLVAHSFMPGSLMALAVAGMHWFTSDFIQTLSYGSILFRVAVTVPPAAVMLAWSLSPADRQACLRFVGLSRPQPVRESAQG